MVSWSSDGYYQLIPVFPQGEYVFSVPFAGPGLEFSMLPTRWQVLSAKAGVFNVLVTTLPQGAMSNLKG